MLALFSYEKIGLPALLQFQINKSFDFKLEVKVLRKLLKESSVIVNNGINENWCEINFVKLE